MNVVLYHLVLVRVFFVQNKSTYTFVNLNHQSTLYAPFMMSLLFLLLTTLLRIHFFYTY